MDFILVVSSFWPEKHEKSELLLNIHKKVSFMVNHNDLARIINNRVRPLISTLIFNYPSLNLMFSQNRKAIFIRHEFNFLLIFFYHLPHFELVTNSFFGFLKQKLKYFSFEVKFDFKKFSNFSLGYTSAF